MSTVVPNPATKIEVPARMNAATFLDRNVSEGFGGKKALVTPERSYSYAEIHEMANRFGNALRSLGVEAENRVLLVAPDGAEFAASYWGAMKIGAIPVPVSTAFSIGDYEFLLNDSGAKVLVAHASVWSKLELVLARVPSLRHVFLIDGEPPQQQSDSLQVRSWEQMLGAASPELAPVVTDKDDVAYWLYSSGTTGFPKGVAHLHRALLYCQLYALSVLEMRPDDVVFSTFGLSFAYALGTSLHMSTFYGATAMVWPDRPQPKPVADYVEKHKPSLFFSVPSFYAKLLKSEHVRPEQFDSVRLALSAGEPLPAELHRRWEQRFGIELCEGIGSTELTYTFISNRPGHTKAGSSGKVVPGNEVRIVDELGNELPPGEPGHLLVKSEATCAYYWRQHQANKDSFHGHWFRTGDVYARDKEGYFYYFGRSDDLFKVDGQWFSPIEVENVLLQHSAVYEAAVVGEPNADGNVKPKAFVVPRNGHAAAPELARTLQEHVRERTASYKYPREVEFVYELPRTASGKMQRYKLRDPKPKEDPKR